METTYIISQIFIVISYAFFALSYIVKNRTKLLIISSGSLILEGASYMLLTAWSGVAMVIVASIRNFLFFIQMKITTFNPKLAKYEWISLVIILSIAIILMIVTYQSFLGTFSILGSIIYTYSVWQKNTLLYKILGVPASALIIIYNVYINSLFGIIAESILLIWILITILKPFVQSRHKQMIKIEVK